MLLCAALVVLVGIQPNPIQVGANAAAQSARMPGTPFVAPVVRGAAPAKGLDEQVATAPLGQ